MRVRDLIKAPKTNVTTAPWKQGSIPPSAFLMRRDQKKRDLGKSWWWRTVDFDALGVPCRVLITFHEIKQQCCLTLGVHDDAGLLRLVCSRDYHPGEPGWHCHTVLRCENGVRWFAHYGLRRMPKNTDQSAAFGLELRTVTAAASRFYRLTEGGDFG